MKDELKTLLSSGVKRIIPVGIVTFFYTIAFFLLEKRDVPYHVIQCKLDNLIPFCEYFIVPYLLWFAYVFVTVIYFAFFCEKEEFKQICFTILSGLIVFLTISYFYPNGQTLRPVLTGKNIFELLVMDLYQTDTPTNILPSLHVFHSVTCYVALIKNERIRKNKLLAGFIFIFTTSIVLATVFLKQHSIIDVVMALIMNGLCYYLFYEDALPFWKMQNNPVKVRRKRRGIQL